MMKVFGIGRFVKDPILKQVGETNVCEFALAVDEYRRINGERKKITSFLDFQIWDKAAELVVKYCSKGDKIHVTATPRQDKWQDKETGQNRSKIVFRVDDFEFVGGKPREDQGVDEEIPY